MDEIWREWLYEAGTGGSMLLLFLVVFVFSKYIHSLVAPFDVDRELTQRDNTALSVCMAGYFSAVFIVFIGAMTGPSEGLYHDVLSVGGYSILGILLLNLSGVVNDRLILYRFSNAKEIIEDRNTGTGTVLAGSYIASGLIVAGAVHGEGGGVLTAVVFYGLGQVTLILFTHLYNFITPFDIHEEIEKDNAAAGISFGGTLAALGIILLKGTCGAFEGWATNLSWFAADVLLAFIVLPLVRLLCDRLIIWRADLNREISRDMNIGAGLLEMTVAIGFATLLFHLI